MSWMQVGRQCVCIMEFAPLHSYVATFVGDVPVIGGVYTIRSVGVCAFTGATVLKFDEIADQYVPLAGIVAFQADHFRPVVTQEQDVEMFAHLLTPTRIEEHV